VSRPFPSWNRSILTEILQLCHACSCDACSCHACSCHACSCRNIEDGNGRAGLKEAGLWDRTLLVMQSECVGAACTHTHIQTSCIHTRRIVVTRYHLANPDDVHAHPLRITGDATMHGNDNMPRTVCCPSLFSNGGPIYDDNWGNSGHCPSAVRPGLTGPAGRSPFNSTCLDFGGAASNHPLKGHPRHACAFHVACPPPVTSVSCIATGADPRRRCARGVCTGGKFSNFEGGVRVVSFLAGGWVPARLRGSTSQALIATADW
jgi:hypothetical protein